MAKKEFFISNKKKIIFLLFILFIFSFYFVVNIETIPKDPTLINEMKEELNYFNKDKEKIYISTVITDELIKKYIYPGMEEQEALSILMLFFNEKIKYEKNDNYHIYYIEHLYDKHIPFYSRKIHVSIVCFDRKVRSFYAIIKFCCL